MPGKLPNRDTELPEERYYDPAEDDAWHVPLENALAELSRNSLVSGEDRGEYDPEDGTLYVPTNPDGTLALGTGASWVELGSLIGPDGTVTGDLTVEGGVYPILPDDSFTESDPPNVYPEGYSIFRDSQGTGFPAGDNSVVETVNGRGPNNFVQRNWTNNGSTIYTRISQNSDGWNDWKSYIMETGDVTTIPGQLDVTGSTTFGDVVDLAGNNLRHIGAIRDGVDVVGGLSDEGDPVATKQWVDTERVANTRMFTVDHGSGDTGWYKVARIDSGSPNHDTHILVDLVSNGPEAGSPCHTRVYINGRVRNDSESLDYEWVQYGSENNVRGDVVVTRSGEEHYLYIRASAWVTTPLKIQYGKEPINWDFGAVDEVDVIGDIEYDMNTADPSFPADYGILSEQGDRVATRQWVNDNAPTGDAGQSTIRAIDFGADPTGASDSTQALLDAIAAASDGDRVIWGEKGTYYLAGEVAFSKRIELDLFEGTIESDYHDELAYPNDQNHYRPLIRPHGTLGGPNESLTAAAQYGEDRVEVADASGFSKGDDVIVRTATTNRETVTAYDYKATQTHVREVDTTNNIVYLDDQLETDFTTSHFISHCDFLERPKIKNVTVVPRTEPAFDAALGKVMGGPRHVIGTEICDHPMIENVSAWGYDSHVVTSRDDIAPVIEDVTARRPMNLSGSCGEPFAIQASRDCRIVRPSVKYCRRAIDARSGCGRIAVEEPDITGVTLTGISWHSLSEVSADIYVNGGKVMAPRTDPTLDDHGGTEDYRWELQRGNAFNTSSAGGEFHATGTTFVSRFQPAINGPTHFDDCTIYHDRATTSTGALEVNGDLTANGSTFTSRGRVSDLMVVTADAGNVMLSDVTFDCSGSPSRGLRVQGGSVRADGVVTDGATAAVEVDAGEKHRFDFDLTCSGNFAYRFTGGEDVSIKGTVSGACQSEVMELSAVVDLDIDANIDASGGSSVRGVRVYDTTDLDITGKYVGPAIGIMFSDDAVNTNIHNMRINVTDGTRAAAVGSDGNPVVIQGLRWVENDMRGAVDDILMNDDVDGFWAVDNVVSNVSTTAGSSGVHERGNYLF